jgi:tryptophan halogenase
MGVVHIDDIIVGINRCERSGDVSAVVTKNHVLDADFVIDATGFEKIVSTYLSDPWEKSHTNVVPCDSALVFQTPFKPDEPIRPYTVAKAMSSGWRWEIPTQDRVGHGYVFASEYLSEDEALKEVSSDVAIGDAEPRLIKFKAHQSKNSWKFNCVSVGLASGFIEPLEATSISATINQTRLLCSYLPTYTPRSVAPQNGYLKIFDSMYENLLSMVAMHYVSDRTDTPFWVNQKRLERPDLLRSLTAIMKHRGPEEHDIPSTGFELFKAAHFWHVGQGQGLISQKGCEANLRDYNAYKNAKKTVERSRNRSLAFSPHRVVLDYAKDPASWRPPPTNEGQS